AKVPATPLTQRRKREAKGIPTTTPVVPSISQANPLLAPKLIRLSAHDPVAQARRANTQRQQAAARKAWKPTDRPEWLDEKFFTKEIQPRLQTIQASTIQSALFVSGPYALRIRGGECVPHARHWVVLARLVGIPI